MDCIFPADRDRFADRLESLMSGRKERFEDTFRIRRADDGRERWVTFNGWRARKGDSSSSRIIATVRDATEEKTAEARIRWSALHDPLTRLGNSALFQEELDNAIRAARANDMQAGVLLLDLDHFKQINDSLGHDVGDALLKMIAERLRESLRKSDTVARLGGDEFAIVVPASRRRAGPRRRSRRPSRRECARRSCTAAACSIAGSARARRYTLRTDSRPDEVLKNADLALYAAKSGGRSRLTIYEPAMRQDLQRAAQHGQPGPRRGRRGSHHPLLPAQARSGDRRGARVSRRCCAGGRRPGASDSRPCSPPRSRISRSPPPSATG